MGRKLLQFKTPYTAFLFLLISFSSLGQCPSSVTISANPGTTVCSDSNNPATITFTANPVGGDSLDFQWQVNGADQGNNSSTFSYTNPQNNATVKVIVTSSTESCSIGSNVLTLTVNPYRTVSFDITSTATAICAGESVSFSAGPITNGGTSPTYRWKINGNPVNGETNPTFTTSALNNNDEVTLEVSSSVPCATPDPATSNNSITITIKPDASISNPSNKDQSLCINTAIDPIEFSIGGGGTGATVSGLPSGLSGSFTNGKYTISGSPTQSGDFIYTVSTTGTCVQTSETGTISVTPDPTISDPSNKNQTVCINTAISAIAFNITAPGSGASVSGLPGGLSWSFSGDTFTITGAPNESGTFPYEVTTTGDCSQVTQSGTITVEPDPTISNPVNKNQTVCINSSIDQINFTVTSPATGANVVDLPPGVSGSFSGNTLSISGTPTTDGTFSYTVTTSGNCVQAIQTGTITVKPDPTISDPTNKNQTVCINTSITPIDFVITAPGDGASFSGLPAGLTGNFSGNTFTISGTPSESGPFNYTVTTTGDCEQVSQTGTITVDPDPTISSPSNKDQTLCINSSIQPINFTVTSPGTGATVVDLPDGLSGNFSGDTFTITGSPTESGTFTYTVNTTGSCVQTSQSGIIEVNADATINLVSANDTQRVCAAGGAGDSEIDPIIYEIGETGNGATVTGLPSGISGNYNSSYNTFTISGSTTLTGAFNYEVTATGSCGPSGKLNGSITVNENLIPTVSIVSGDNNNTICSGEQVTFTANPENGGDSPTYQWIVDGSPSGSVTSDNTFTTSLSNGQTVSVEMTSSEECVTQQTVSSSNSISIQVDEPLSGTLEFDLDYSPSAVCPVASGIEYRVNSITGATSYHWTFPSGWTPTTGTVSGNQTITTTNAVTVTATASAQQGQVTVYAQNECGQTSPIDTPVNPGTVVYVSAGPDQVVCAGTTEVTLAGEIGGIITKNNEWDWSADKSGGGFSNGGNNLDGIYTLPTSIRNGGQVTITITSIDPPGQCGPKTDEMTIKVLSPPTLSDPGNKNQSVCLNSDIEAISFTLGGSAVDASVAGLPADLTGTLSGNTFTINGTPTQAGSFNYTVTTIGETTTSGSCTQTTQTGTITVNPLPTVTEPSAVIACNEETISTITFTSSSVTGTTYEWVNDNPAIGLAANGTGNIQAFTASNSTNEPITAYITVTPVADGCEGSSATFSITVNPTATLTKPTDISNVCNGESINTISFTGSNVSGTTYEWANDNTAIGLAANGTGDISSFTATNNTDSPITATITITPVANSCDGTQESFTITVDPTPSVTQPSDITDICNGDTVGEISFSGSNVTGTIYNWENDNTEIGVASNGSGNIPGFTATNVTNSPITATITVTPVANGCEGAPQSFDITINPSPTVNKPEDVTGICNGENISTISLSGSNVAGTVYNWTNNNTDIGLGASGSGDIPGFTATNTTSAPINATITVIPLVNGCAGPEETFTITVDPTPVVTKPADITGICNGETISAISFSGGNASNISFEWENDTPGIGLAASGSGDIAAFSAINNTNTPITATISVTPVANGCEGTTESFSIIVNPSPTVNEVDDITYCNGETSSEINFSGEVSGTSFTWTNDNNQIGLPASGTGDIPSFTTENTTNTAITANITITPEANGCTGEPKTFKIIVNPAPTVDAGPDQTICSNGTATMAATLAGGASSGTWSSNGSGSFSNNSESAVYSPSSSDIANGSVVLTYTTDDPEGPCGAASDEMTLTINKEPVITTQPFNVAVCTANDTQLEVVAVGDNLHYEWYRKDSQNEVPVGNDSNILALNNVTSNDAGTYYVMVSGESACETLKSNEVSVNVDENIIITTQPQGQELCINDNLTLSIAATTNGNPPVFQWRKDGVNLNNDARISGANSANLIITGLTLADAGDYDVQIDGDDAYTCNMGYSNVVEITIFETPTVNAGEDFSACSTANSINIGGDASATNYSSLEWTTSGTGTFADAAALSTSYTPGNGETGNITLTLTANGNSTCGEVTDDVVVSIVPLPVIDSFTYAASEYCESNSTNQSPSIEGQNAYTEGSFSYVFNDEGSGTLALNPSTGEITPSGSTVGSYTVTYTTPDDEICGTVSETFDLVIGALPVADFSYAASPYCNNSSNPIPSLENGAIAGTFSSTTGLVFVDTATGEIDIATSTPGTYTITNTIAPANGCVQVTATAPITITKLPVADFSYDESPYCNNGINPNITLAPGAETGIFTSTAGLVFEDNTTGEIDINASTPGTYEVTNTIAQSEGCEEVTATASLTISALPDATFSYAEGGYCLIDEIAVPTVTQSGGIFSSNPDLGSHLDPATGEITWSDTEDITGSYVVTYRFEAADGCEEVSQTQTIYIDPVPEGGELLFQINNAEPDRIFTICESATTGYAVPLVLTGSIGNVVAWRYRESSASQWTEIKENGELFTGTTLSAGLIESLPIDESTVFRVEISSGACLPNTFSATALLSIIPSDIEPSPVSVSEQVICKGETVTLSSGTGYGNEYGEFEGGAFDYSSITNKGWRITDDDGNTDYNFDSSADNLRPDKWLRTNPHDFITANISTNEVSPQRWDSSLSDDGNKGFAISSGPQSSTLETPIFSLTSMDEAILTFDQAYNLTDGAHIMVQISTNGGNSYSSEPILYEKYGPASSGNYDRFGDGTVESTPNNKIVIDLGNYIGKSNLRIRFSFEGVRDGDIWALDAIKVPDGPQDAQLIWYYDQNLNDPDNDLIQIGEVNQGTVTFEPPKLGWNDFEVKTFLLFDTNGDPCETAENSQTIRVFVFDEYTTTASATSGSCGSFSSELSATVSGAFGGAITEYPTADGYIGEWFIEGPEGYTLTDSDPNDDIQPKNNPNATFTAENLGSYTFTWRMVPTEEDDSGQIMENIGCTPTYNIDSIEVVECSTLDFDGVDDYVDLGTSYTGNRSIEAWIRPFDRPLPDGSGNTNASTGTIISGPGFEIGMEDLPPGITPGTRWYHIAVSSTGELWVDGIPFPNITINGNGGSKTIIGAHWNPSTKQTENHFSGWIEEVRIWNKAITQEQIRFLMNQHIDIDQTSKVKGEVIPAFVTVPGEPDYSDLVGYYRLVAQIDAENPDTRFQITNGYTPDHGSLPVDGKLVNMETLQTNNGPMPYTSRIGGQNWATDNTWTHFPVWDAPNSKGINGSPIEWNIVKTSHDIQSGNKDITVLGLLSETGQLTMMDPGSTLDEYNLGQMLRVTHYLKLDGIIDLQGESQLLQDEGSILDNNSPGYLERDQQGKRNSFVYNYWTSPVSPQGTDNNAPYSLGEILLDGTDYANPTKDIIYIYDAFAADGARPDPIIISTRWVWGYFPAVADVYAEWDLIKETGTLRTGEGFTMKGTDGTVGIEAEQNYTFRGKPHNGDFDLVIGAGQNYLIGNPFPSALDGFEFIRDNLKDVAGGRNEENVFDGSLYFWDHFIEVNHVLRQYIGGYAALNLSGGTPAYTTDERVDESARDGDKSPEQYIPVAQGILINSTNEFADFGVNVTGGDIHFKNSQRAYKREQTDASIFMKPEDMTKETVRSHEDNRAKIRLKFHSPTGYHRQILVTRDEHTSFGPDLGYDAPLIEDNPEDMYWLIDSLKLVIQGVPDFDKASKLPLGIKVEENGYFKIQIDSLENFPTDIPVYLKDKLLDTIHDLKVAAYNGTAKIGTTNDRFEIVFQKEEKITPPVPEAGISTVDFTYNYKTRELKIENPELVPIHKIMIFDLQGKLVQQFKDIPLSKEYLFEIKPVRTSIYIVKVVTKGGAGNKKFIMK